MRPAAVSAHRAALISVLLVAGTGPVALAERVSAAEPPAAVPRIRLITYEQDTLVKVIRVIRAEPRAPVLAPLPSHPGWLWPVPGRLTSGYGLRRHPITRDQRFHAGIDLAAPAGTPVRAAADGQVRIAQWAGGYGHLIELDHGHGWTTRYGHLQRRLVDAGARVAAGDILALVGSTGLSTGPHLHFELRRHGRPLDPLLYLSAPVDARLAACTEPCAGGVQ